MRYLAVDCPFNRANYPHLIGQTFHNPPSYIAVADVQENWDQMPKDAVTHSDRIGLYYTNSQGQIVYVAFLTITHAGKVQS